MEDIKTGDIVLFKGNGFISKLIMLGGGNKSHIEQVYIDNGKTLLYGSTNSVKPTGVKLRHFKSVVDNYDGDVYLRRLSKPLTPVQIKIFEKNISKNIGKKYEESIFELILSAMGRFFNLMVSEPSSSLYCSELIKLVFKALGFITHSKALTPSDFSEEQQEYLELQHITLGPEIKLN